jgi:hypothetical protein
MKYSAILIFLVACSQSTSREKESDLFATFSLNQEYEYLSGLGPDRIIMKLTRTEKDKFSYRIELMRNYFGLPLDHGTVTLKGIEQDTLFNLEGGNEECQLKLKMYQSSVASGGQRIIIERSCKDTTWNIAGSDFSPLWKRGERH